ncbi:MAG TPA: TonB family protein [Thermodesulfobacteriota bacterium]|nr:TonB family protein [Thermodesulfobacteriota bacterium]
MDKRIAKQEEKPEFIEITEVPVPKEKETEPSKEAKRYAERSHQAPEEKTKDDFTKRGSISSLPQPKQQLAQPKKSEKITKAEEKPRKEEPEKESPKIASLPKDREKELRIPEKEIEKEVEQKKIPEITKEDLFSSAASNLFPEQQEAREFLGSRDIEKKEDTVDLNTTEFKYFSYFLKLKRQIEGVWNYPETSRLRGEQGELFLVFTIKRNGELEDVNLIDPSGYVRLDEEAVRAIRVAAPFSPFPESWNLERLNVRAVFRYQISYGWSVK